MKPCCHIIEQYKKSLGMLILKDLKEASKQTNKNQRGNSLKDGMKSNK